MLNTPNLQHPGQIPEKSTTMWTTPHTDEQKRYFSKHAPKRRAYGLIQTVLQALHAFLAFAAWVAVFAWAFDKVPVLQPYAPHLACVLLGAFHILFRVTWSTYWYDRLDKDDRTDSSISIPLIIMAVLLFTESQGARMFLEQQVKPLALQSTDQADQAYNSAVSEASGTYAATVKNIETVYREKQRAAALPYNNRIAQLRKRRLDDEAERRSVYNQIAEQERQRDAAIAPIAAAKAAELEAALKRQTEQQQRATARRDTHVEQVDTHNQGEQQRHSTDMDNAGTLGWIISAVLLLLISALGYAQVRINVNSGILPLRNFTVLDAHGSMVERVATALGDATNRRTLQFSVWLHRILSPQKELQSFDGTVVARPGSYNTPKGVFTPANTPAPPQQSQLLGEAYQKVWAKIEQMQRQYPGYTPSREVLNNELNKALAMNGTYASAPWEDDVLGKP